MTPIVGDLIKNTVGKVVGKLVDHYLPESMSESEKAKFKLKAEELSIAAGDEAAKDVTSRHRYDMQSDSWLSKNIRPMVLIYLVMAWSALAVAGIGHTVPPEFIEMLKDMLKAVFAFYFIGRSFEKSARVIFSKDK